MLAEEQHGYEILALHLRNKASLVTAGVHDSIFALAGFDLGSPSRSVVSNTLAFQHLVLDFPLWCETEAAVQRTHFDRLRELVTTSDFADYNLKKLTKLRACFFLSRSLSSFSRYETDAATAHADVVRKIVSALRGKAFEPALIDQVVDFFMLVVRSAFTTDSVRYLATYLAAALTTGASLASRRASASARTVLIL